MSLGWAHSWESENPEDWRNRNRRPPTILYSVNVTGVPGHRYRDSGLFPSISEALERLIEGLQTGAMAKSAGLVSRDPIHVLPWTPLSNPGCDAEQGLSLQRAVM